MLAEGVPAGYYRKQKMSPTAYHIPLQWRAVEGVMQTVLQALAPACNEEYQLWT